MGEHRTGTSPSAGEEETKVFKSLDDYLRHYGARKDKEPGQNEWYELGAEAARRAISQTEAGQLAGGRTRRKRRYQAFTSISAGTPPGR